MNPNRRSAFSLAEMVAAITLVTLVAGLAVSLLHSLMMAESRAQRAAPRRAAVAELRDAIRADIRRADRVSEEGKRLVIDCRRSLVTYELEGERCTRRIDAASSPRVYRAGVAQKWLVAHSGSVVGVQLQRSDDARDGPFHVAGALGAALPHTGRGP